MIKNNRNNDDILLKILDNIEYIIDDINYYSYCFNLTNVIENRRCLNLLTSLKNYVNDAINHKSNIKLSSNKCNCNNSSNKCDCNNDDILLNILDRINYTINYIDYYSDSTNAIETKTCLNLLTYLKKYVNEAINHKSNIKLSSNKCDCNNSSTENSYCDKACFSNTFVSLDKFPINYHMSSDCYQDNANTNSWTLSSSPNDSNAVTFDYITHENTKINKSFPFSKTINADNGLVNHPKHYTNGSIECIDAIQESMGHREFCGYLKGNVLKYLWRYKLKNNPVTDLKKAMWYLNKLIKVVELDVKKTKIEG